MLVSIENMLNRALVHQYAVGQFNINNPEWTGTVLNVAQKITFSGYFRRLRWHYKTYAWAEMYSRYCC